MLSVGTAGGKKLCARPATHQQEILSIISTHFLLFFFWGGGGGGGEVFVAKAELSAKG